MKQIYVIGDSISMHYGPFLEELCKGEIPYNRKSGDEGYIDLDNPQGANGGDSKMVLDFVKWQKENGQLDYDLLLLNCGLHDIKTANGIKQVTPEEYEENLREILNIYKSAGIDVIFINTTPAFEEIHNVRCGEFKRHHSDVKLYNKIAEKVMNENGVRVIDLYSFTLPFLPDGYCDHIHFNEPIRKAQAEFIFENL